LPSPYSSVNYGRTVPTVVVVSIVRNGSALAFPLSNSLELNILSMETNTDEAALKKLSSTII